MLQAEEVAVSVVADLDQASVDIPIRIVNGDEGAELVEPPLLLAEVNREGWHSAPPSSLLGRAR